jgi:murein DD-endopeptidase MepM/ murein hydrolase activator NlpD
VSARSHDGRHRASKSAPAKPRRFIGGLALPTAAAAALTFTATGAAVASVKPQAVAFTKIAAVSVSAPLAAEGETPATSDGAADPEQFSQHRSQAAKNRHSSMVRADTAAQVARSAQRKELAARTVAKEAALEERAHSWRLPIKTYVLTSGFGSRWGRQHEGEDFAAPEGTDLVSMSTGTVTFAGPESGFGNLVKIRYWDGTITYYGHMSSISVTSGEHVEPAEVVGQSGNTGHSTGPHLHLEVHPDGGAPIDPLPWLADRSIAP